MFSIAPALPSGLALDASTGLISGTPSVVTESISYTVTASNADGSTEVILAVTVQPTAAPSLFGYADNPAVYSFNRPIEPNVPSVMGEGIRYSVTPALPTGLALHPTTGVVSGTPVVEGEQTYRITATNGVGSTFVDLFLKVAPRAPLWVAAGPVWATALKGNTLFVGGEFSRLDRFTGRGLLVDSQSSGKPSFASWPVIDGRVVAVVEDPSSTNPGGYYIGGDFTRVGSDERIRLARIRFDGSVDPNWSPRAEAAGPTDNATVQSLAVENGVLYIGGLFSKINGEPRSYLAAVNAETGSLISTFAPLISGSHVSSLVISGGRLYVGGTFTGIDGDSTYSNLAAYDITNNQWADWKPEVTYPTPSPNATVHSLAVHEGKVYFGGWFERVRGVSGLLPRYHFASVDADTGLANSFVANCDNGTVFSIAIDSGTMYVGGSFYHTSGSSGIQGQNRNRLAAFDLSTGILTSWNPDPNGIVRALLRKNGRLWVGGNFTAFGGTSINRAASFTLPDGVLKTDWNPNPNAGIFVIASSGATHFLGGNFTGMGGKDRSRLAAIDLSTGEPTDWNPGASCAILSIPTDDPIQCGVRSLLVNGSSLIIGGRFDTVNSTTRNHLASVSTETGNLTAWNPNANGTVHALALSGSTLFAGGDFTTIDSESRSRLAAFDLSSAGALASGWNHGFNDSLRAFAVGETALYAGGDFTMIGSDSRNRLASFSLTTGALNSWNPSVSHIVHDLALDSGNLYAGGEFTTVDAQSRSRLAAFSLSDGSLSASWKPEANGPVYALAAEGGFVYAGGGFTTVDSDPLGGVAKIGSDGVLDTLWNPDLGNYVYTLLANGNAIYAGGGVNNLTQTNNTKSRTLVVIDVPSGKY